MKYEGYKNWVDWIRAEPQRALTSIYLEERAYCLSWIGKTYNLPVEDCADIYQRAVVLLINKARNGQIKETKAKPSSFLIGVCRLIGLEWLRNRKKHLKSENLKFMLKHLLDKETIDEKVMERYETVRDFILKMGEKCQQIIRLYFFEELTMKDIASTMGYSVGAAKNKKVSCMNELKNHFTNSNE